MDRFIVRLEQIVENRRWLQILLIPVAITGLLLLLLGEILFTKSRPYILILMFAVGCGVDSGGIEACEDTTFAELEVPELWDSCPTEIQAWTSVIDGHCYYTDSCGKEWRITGCFLADGTMCPTTGTEPQTLIRVTTGR